VSRAFAAKVLPKNNTAYGGSGGLLPQI